MNFLAHFYLSGQDESIQLGNYLGDFLRGSEIRELPNPILKGVELHRHIDSFTDSHPVVKETVTMLRDPFAKYAGVALDVFYDHFLAVAWKTYSRESLDRFAEDMYAMLERNRHYFNHRADGFYGYMIRTRVLTAYGQKQGIAQVLRNMSYRTGFNSNLEQGGRVLEERYNDLQVSFDSFFPDLVQSSKTYLESNE